jgi:GNAT superfamily N-acetyltransferase
MNRTLAEATLDPETCLAAGVTAAGPYVVRPAGPQDAATIREFITNLSVQTQYLRFFTVVSPPSGGLLRALAGGPRADILIITDELGVVIGHGMAVDADHADRVCADIGLVIADSWQGQGLGTVLLQVLVDRAARRGVSGLLLEVLPGNRRMLGIISRRWPDAERRRTADAISVSVRIDHPRAGLNSEHSSPQQASYQGGRHERDRSAAYTGR